MKTASASSLAEAFSLGGMALASSLRSLPIGAGGRQCNRRGSKLVVVTPLQPREQLWSLNTPSDSALTMRLEKLHN
jgi:hypothetical protein